MPVSIFERKKPLAENTMRRIAKGLQKFVIDNPAPFIVQVNHGGDAFRGANLDKPFPTVTAKHGFGVVTPYVMVNQHQNAGSKAEAPLHTVLTGNHHYLIAPNLIQYHGEQSGKEVRGQDLQRPLLVVDASNRYGLVTTHLVQMNKSSEQDLAKPFNTVTAGGGHFAEVRAFLIKYYGQGEGQKLDNPLHTITTKDRFGLITVAGAEYQIVDIGMRMLTPRELFRAQGFSDDYIIEHDDKGKPYPKSAQVARCGNAVPPQLPAALVKANLPELCGEMTERKVI